MVLGEHGSAVVTFPSDLEIVVTRTFEAPIGLVFDVMTKPEYVRRTIAPFDEEVTVCSIDLQVGGEYHHVFVTGSGMECSFRGTFLEIVPPTRTVETWRFDGWPDVEAIETIDLHESDGFTEMAWRLAFPDQAGRDRIGATDGIEGNFDKVGDLLNSLLV